MDTKNVSDHFLTSGIGIYTTFLSITFYNNI